MDKKLIFFFLLSAAMGASALAQSPVRLNGITKGFDTSAVVPYSEFQIKGKKQDAYWYNFIDASATANGGHMNFIISNNISLFPDSTVKTLRSDSVTGNMVFGHVNLHNIGQIFDPQSFHFENQINESTPYSIDSIAIAFRYANKQSGSTDTLEFQALYNESVRWGNLVSPDQSPTVAWIVYDREKENGANAQQEWKIVIDNSDTSWESGFKIKTFALPQLAYVKAGSYFAITYKYTPGYAYNSGDTLSMTTIPSPQNPLNHFQQLVVLDTTKTIEESFNKDLEILSFNKYDPNDGWAEAFIPGDIWNPYTKYAYISFHVTAEVGLASIEQASLNIYPNPSNGNELVNIAFTLNENTNVSVDVYDLLGKKVQTVLNGNLEAGEQVATVNASSLDAGIYVYSIKAGDQVITGKMSIIK